MEVYWRLASVDASVREAASVELVQGLLLQDSRDKPEKKKKKKDKAEKKQQTEVLEKLEDCQKGAENEEGEKEGAADQEKLAQKRKNKATLDNETREEAAFSMPTEEKGGPQSHIRTNDYLLSGTLANDDGFHNCSPAVQYALKRLTRGLASSRECARQGFAMALASLLEALPYIKMEPMLQLIKKSLEVTSSMKGQEKRDGLLGQLFAYGAVVRSGRLTANYKDMEAANLAKDVTEQLLVLAKKKVFLREPAVTVLLYFIEELPPGVLQDSILSSPVLQETLCMDIENASADTLLLALKLHKHLPSCVVDSCLLLPKTKSTLALFEPSHLLSLVPVLKDSSSCHPRVHPIWSFLIGLLFQESNDQGLPALPRKKKKRQKLNDIELEKTVDQWVASFWDLVVTNALLTSSHERKYLSMELLKLILPKLSAPCAQFILSKTLVRCLLDILTAKGNLLYKSAQTCLEAVCEWAKADEQRIVTVIVALQHASHGNFDILSKTQTVKQLMSLLKSKKGCFLLYNELMELFNGEKSSASEIHQLHSVENDTNQNGLETNDRREKDHTGSALKSVEAQRYWILEQISSFVKQIDEQDLRLLMEKQVLKFLTMNALFVGPLGERCYVKELQEELQLPGLPISENTRKLCLARLQNVLVNVSPIASPVQDKRSSGVKQEIVQKKYLASDLRFFFLELCDMLDKIPNVSRVQPVSEDDKDAINALRLCVSQLCSADIGVNNKHTQKMRAMGSLLMQFLLQSATTGVNDTAFELILCCKKAFGEVIEVDANGIVQEDGESLSFMDVLVDILLSLLAQSSAPIRAAAEQVFRSFCGDLTESNMLSLLRVVKKQLKSGRRVAAAPLDIEENDEDEFLEVEESDDDSDVIDDDENDRGSEDESHKDGNDDDNQEETDPKRLHTWGSDEGKVANKKRSAEPDHEMSKDESDSEDSSSSDMDDEAMFKIDVHLANLLKQRGAASGKGEGKDAQTQLLHFKFRVLSLIEYFFQKKASSPFCLTALSHLLQVLVSSSSAGGNAQLADRISSILQGSLFKSKEYPKGEHVDNAALKALFQRCVKLASRSKIKKVRQVTELCCLWLVKVLHGQPLCGGDETANLIKELHYAMNDFFSQKKCRLRTPFFCNLFTRFPGIGLAFLGLLLDRCKNARSEFLQHEALILVNLILHLNTGKKSSAFKENLMEHLPALSGVLLGLIEKPPSNKARKSESRRFCVSLLKAVAQELPEKPVRKHIGKPAYDLCISHFGASIMEGVVKVKGVSSVSYSHGGKGTPKKRTKSE